MLFGATGFLTMFTLGGISGIMLLAVVPFDIHVSDTYFIVAHIHYVLFGGSVFMIFAGIYHWFQKMTGRMYDESPRQGALLAVVRLLQPDLRAHAPGRHRRNAGRWPTTPRSSYLEGDHLEISFILPLVPDLLYNMIASWRNGPLARTRGEAHSLEVGRSHHRRVFNFDQVPTVVTTTPRRPGHGGVFKP